MDDKITLPALTQLLALKTGDTKKQSEDFIKEFFSVISDALAGDESVKIKDFGVFKTVPVEARKSVNVSNGEEHQIPPHRKAVFIPTKELAAYVNQPFEMFETVEVAEGVSLDDIDSSQIDEIDSREQESTLSTEPEVSTTPEPEVSTTTEPEKDVMYELTEDLSDETEEITMQASAVNTSVSESDLECDDWTQDYSDRTLDCKDRDLDYNDQDVSLAAENKNRFRFIGGFAAGFACAAVISVLLFFLCPGLTAYLSERNVSKTTVVARDSVSQVSTGKTSSAEEKNAVDPDTVIRKGSNVISGDDKTGMGELTVEEEEVPTSRSDAPVYDVISKTRYLTTMAKDHYGNYNLWPIIYEENKAILGHPDRIKPGTRVIVPPLSKYGVNPNNKKDIENAKRKGVEIYSRYK